MTALTIVSNGLFMHIRMTRNAVRLRRWKDKILMTCFAIQAWCWPVRAKSVELWLKVNFPSIIFHPFEVWQSAQLTFKSSPWGDWAISWNEKMTIITMNKNLSHWIRLFCSICVVKPIWIIQFSFVLIIFSEALYRHFHPGDNSNRHCCSTDNHSHPDAHCS